MKIYPIDNVDLLNKHILIKSSAYEVELSAIDRIRKVFHVDRVPGLEPVAYTQSIRSGVKSEGVYFRAIEGWVDKEEVEKLLMWEKLAK